MRGPAQLLRRLVRDRRGLSAVEFALIAPVMILIYFGVTEFCQGFMAQRRVNHTASAIADMVARTDTLTAQQADDILAIGALIMRPFSTTPLKRRVASVVLDDNKVAKVAWVHGDAISGKPLAKGDTVTLPDGLVSEVGQSVIMADTAYDYKSPIGQWLPDPLRFSQTYYLLPRTVDRVTLSP